MPSPSLYNSKLSRNIIIIFEKVLLKGRDGIGEANRLCTNVFKKSTNPFCTIFKFYVAADLFIFNIYQMVIGKVNSLFVKSVSEISHSFKP